MKRILRSGIGLSVIVLIAAALFMQGCSGGGGGASVSSLLTSASTGNTTTSSSSGTGFESRTPDELTAFTAAQVSGTAGTEGSASPVTTFDDGTSTSLATFEHMSNCTGCHAGVATTYNLTNHGTAWTRKAVTTYAATYEGKTIFGYYKDKYNITYCINCHTVNGSFYDANSNHTYDAGVDTAAFGIAPYSYTSYEDVNSLNGGEYAGIQCENCHGPGSLHVAGATTKIVGGAKAGRSSTCMYCHAQYKDWLKSGHAISISTDSTVNEASTASGRAKTSSGACSGCHTGDGFIVAIDGGREPVDMCVATTQEGYMPTQCTNGATDLGNYAVGCATCHDPHETHTGIGSQLRVARNEICGKCHNGRYRKYTQSGTTRYTYVPGGARRVHNPQYEMVVGGYTRGGGVQPVSGTPDAYSYGYATRTAVIKWEFIQNQGGYMGETTCADCHMYSYTNREAGIEWTGHTFKPQAEACNKCHAGMNAKATIDAIQGRYETKVNNLETRLNNFLNSLPAASFSTTTDSIASSQCGEGKTAGARCCNAYALTTSSSTAEKTAKDYCALVDYNIEFLKNDKSEGVHNEPYMNTLYTVSDSLLKTLGF